MKFEKTKLDGVYIVSREPFEDERGTFARMFCKRELEAAGLRGDIAQVNISTNSLKGTLRGLHTQTGEFAEDKFIACVRGAVFDVAVDVREGSATFGQWVGAELSEENCKALYVPKGFAHGYLTLADDAWVQYFVTQFYEPGAERAYRYDDPAFGIEWMGEIKVVSRKDTNRDFVSNREDRLND
ncbi:MAG: dTDP-4-dehydrorhamnose 3,5-epimerase [Prevotellaceae bacterium]|jgi:dTDP-4-dehydrorhamnose 3,5-epimerase|nr:dTDP-4-dehydrorhamnose 3,5-epimerase [Prevotellaceae bacterium]